MPRQALIRLWLRWLPIYLTCGPTTRAVTKSELSPIRGTVLAMSLSDNIFSSPLWKRCDPIEEDDEATAIWDAWWGHDIEPDVKPFPVMPTSVAIGLGSREGAPLPATFRTIDLGSFLFGAAPGPIILRGDYETAIKALNEGHDRKKSRGALITGESGIGEFRMGIS